jgi:dimethylargininase
MFRNAIVRTPGSNFDGGLTTASLGLPRMNRVLEQHEQYCQALAGCGLTLTALGADLRFPDSTFVEDTAILTARAAILTRPGAPSRQGEVDAVRPAIREFFPTILAIEPPGTLDGGDICDAEDHFFLVPSHRSNREGVRQLAAHLTTLGYTSSVIDVRWMTSILHLKSGIAYIGDNTLVVMDELAEHPEFRSFDRIRVLAEESYAANCIRVNDRVLIAAGYPKLAASLETRGFDMVVLEMSEFKKMDGGLSCLSLRF